MTAQPTPPVKVFISHHSSQKHIAALLKTTLKDIGCTAFVAHEDIEPTREWVKVIQAELHAMDVLVGMVSTKFNTSVWCQQEVGWAMGRNIPTYFIAFEDTAPPIGFAGFQQAFTRTGNTLDSQIKDFTNQLLRHLTGQPNHNHTLRKFFIHELRTSSSFAHTDQIINRLRMCSGYDDDDRASVVTTYNTNHQVRDCFYARSRLSDILNISSFKQT